MADEDQGAGTGRVKITEGYLESFAQQRIQDFIMGLRDNDDYRNIEGFAGGAAGPGGYAKLLAGSKDFPAGQELQQRYAAFCKGLKQELDRFAQSMTDLSKDLLSVHQVLDKAEADTELSASQMMQDLQDILNGFGGKTPPPQGNSPGTA
ncbi:MULTISPECIES: hypothetical protein [Streptomyces]|uniref:Type VII secretion system-associated protein n=1 Tax=Streptomyces ramulosus TaxID=47762 RepID=A0ABW1FDP7_9ACTN